MLDLVQPYIGQPAVPPVVLALPHRVLLVRATFLPHLHTSHPVAYPALPISGLGRYP